MKSLFLLLGCLNWAAYSSPAHKWRVPSSRTEDDTAHHSDLNKPGQCYCGVPNAVIQKADIDQKIVFGDRIVGGDKSLLGEYPWQVALLDQGVISGHICGGTLVSSLHVITAAHCTAGRTAKSLAVAVGFTNLTSTAQDRFIIGVKEIRDHPNYIGEETHFEDDISIIILSEEIDLTLYPHIKPACLLSSNGIRPQDGWYVEKKAVVSGWGLTDYFYGTYPEHLQDVEVTVYGKNCRSLSGYIRDSQFCAGHDEGGKDACQGDSGGPLMAKDEENNMAFTLIGVVSAGSTCADKEYPGLYTDVKKYCIDGWLEEQMAGANLCGLPPSENIASSSTTTTTAMTSTWW